MDKNYTSDQLMIGTGAGFIIQDGRDSKLCLVHLKGHCMVV